MRLAMMVVACGALWGAPASAALELNGPCPGPFWPTGATPGLTPGDSYLAVRGRVPASAGCDDRQREGCEFVDRHGYTNYFGPFTDWFAPPAPHTRVLFHKIAYRAHGAALPYGVRWTDSKAGVLRRLKGRANLNYDESNRVEVFTCHGVDTEAILTSFEFDEGGHLAKIDQFIDP